MPRSRRKCPPFDSILYNFTNTKIQSPKIFQFMVNEALNKLRRTTNDSSSSLLIDHNDYTSAESSSFITNPSRSPPATLVAPVKHSTISHQTGCEKRPATDTHGLSSITAYTSGSNPSKRSKISSSSSSSSATSFPTTTSSKSGNTASSTESTRESPFFDIHDKLRELYGLLYYNDEQNRRTETRVSFFSFFFNPLWFSNSRDTVCENTAC